MKPHLLLTLPLAAALAWPFAAQAAEPRPATPAVADDAETAAPRAARARPAARAFRPVLKTGVDDVLLEAGHFPRAPKAGHSSTLRASPYALWQPAREWELRVGARLDAVSQGGGSASYDEVRGDITDTYIRFRRGDTRLTLGAQTIIWGRVDGSPVIDRVSRVDLTRFALDDLPERRRAQLALRWEQSLGDFKLDAVALPSFRGARLPDVDSVWSPVDRERGRIIGVAPSPGLAALVGAARIGRSERGSGGGALRLSRSGGKVDFGLTLARTRQTLPYYRVDVLAPSLTAVYPYNSFAGLDAEFITGAFTWRAEFGHTSDVPVTLPSGTPRQARALDGVVGVEFFPGGADTRVTLQLAGRSLRSSQTILELKNYLGVNGEVESTFAQGRWKLGMRFFSGLNEHDLYLAPKLSYLGWEPVELFAVARFFDGGARTLGGFHRDHDMFAIGLSTRF